MRLSAQHKAIRWGFPLLIAAFALSGCGASDGSGNGQAVECPTTLPYAEAVESFEAGSNAGFGQSEFPEIVLGAPTPGPPTFASLDVLSLGAGGTITLSFGDREVLDGPGPDFIIWENTFWVGGNAENPFAELAEVSVSFDGEDWHTFECNPDTTDGFDSGCAGWRPRREFDPCKVLPLEPDTVGGDAFDLSELGVNSIRFIRIRDLSESGTAPSAGFDLDAVGGVHLSE